MHCFALLCFPSFAMFCFALLCYVLLCILLLCKHPYGIVGFSAFMLAYTASIPCGVCLSPRPPSDGMGGPAGYAVLP